MRAQYRASLFRVYAGSHALSSPGPGEAFVGITRLTIHPSYDTRFCELPPFLWFLWKLATLPRHRRFDLALLHLDAELEQEPLCLPGEVDATDADAVCWTAGWGSCDVGESRVLCWTCWSSEVGVQ